MKIVLEITDEQLQALVSAQVGAAVSKYTDEKIEFQVGHIVAKKLERFDKSALPDALRIEARKLLEEVLGRSPYDKANHLRKILGETATELIKEASK